MYLSPVFHKATDGANLAFARNRAFGTLAINGPDAEPILTHIPFSLHKGGTYADLHLIRSNPIVRALDAPRAAVLAVTGPDTYISPDWYGLPDQVPTWNYVAVHLRGTLVRLEAGEMRALLDRQSADYETRLLPKTPWTTAKMTPEVLEKMLHQIVPFRFDVTSVEGTWKLGQNKTDVARLSAAEQLSGDIGQEVAALAALMRAPPQG